MNYQGNSYRQDKEPFFPFLECSYPLESNVYRHRNRVHTGRREPKCSLVQWCMSRQGTVCMRRQHGIDRPGRGWLRMKTVQLVRRTLQERREILFSSLDAPPIIHSLGFHSRASFCASAIW